MASASAASGKVAAGTVLYRPDASVLDGLLCPLEEDGVALFVFVNGPLDTASEARLGRSGATLLRAPVNLGLGHGLNAVVAAAEAAGFAFVLLFDQDSAPPPGLAGKLAAHFARLPRESAALGPRMVPPEGEAFLVPWVHRRAAAANGISPVDFLPTSGTLVAIDAWKRIGPFRADYFVDGIDVEWCFRAWSLGHGCYLAEELTMVHRWGEADTASRKPQILRQSPTRTYYYLRNAFATLRLAHVPGMWRARLLTRLSAQILLLLCCRGRERAVRAAVFAAARAGLSGKLGPIPPNLT